MLKYALVCVLLTCGVLCRCRDIARLDANVGFSVVNVTCGDHECVSCALAEFANSAVLYTFENTLQPYDVEFTSEGADNDWRFIFDQADVDEPFRWCAEMLAHPGILKGGYDWKGDICFDNDVYRSGITVPQECVTPLMLVTLEGNVGHKGRQGRQILYCIPH
ncbi:uncharacterized protein LOC110988811 [Acanthaster planci]|uniref:Uncharacterized protein LOC110988811 n=1 Tax=Acanthaster planci TaxID=133434 RepID=A0A8B7ZUA1_ACAPL|nr:uncharacterized protein LOC110988811 [Acanthaster planci]